MDLSPNGKNTNLHSHNPTALLYYTDVSYQDFLYLYDLSSHLELQNLAHPVSSLHIMIVVSALIPLLNMGHAIQKSHLPTTTYHPVL
jgi:hypothetical protein